MNETLRDSIIAFSLVGVIMLVGFGGLFLYSGQFTPYSVVVSGSMQHSDDSAFGIIDTGDVVIVRYPDKVGGVEGIQSYVDGYHNNYSKFGEFGDVIIYERGRGYNPVIHRPIVWLEWNGTTWDAPSLNGFPGWTISKSGTPDGMGLSGELTLTNIGFAKKTVSLTLTPALLGAGQTGGFVTMGDSTNNMKFDQTSGIYPYLVNENIKYVSGFEIPWIGALKMMWEKNPNVSQIPANSIPSLITSIVCLAVAIIGLALALQIASSAKRDREREREEDGEK